MTPPILESSRFQQAQLMEQQREVYFWPFSLNVNEAIPCKQAENLKVFVQAGIMLRKEFKNVFSSVTEICIRGF